MGAEERVNCMGAPSFYAKSGWLMFNTMGVCDGWPNDCNECDLVNDPRLDSKED